MANIDHKTMRLLLQVLATPTTVMTQAQMLAAVELLGFVGEPSAVKALQFASQQPSASAPATVLGLAGSLKDLVKLNPDHKPADYAKLESYIHHMTTAGADQPLTFGLLLQIANSVSSQPKKR